MQDNHLHIPNRVVLLFLLVLAVLVMFWVLFTRGLLTGSRASTGSNCRKTTFKGKCIMECRHRGETFTVPCPASSSSSQQTVDAAATPTVTPKPKTGSSSSRDEKDEKEDPGCHYETDEKCTTKCHTEYNDEGERERVCEEDCVPFSKRVCD